MASILVTQRTDDLVVDIGDGEGGLKRSSRRHGADGELYEQREVAREQRAEVRPVAKVGRLHREQAGSKPAAAAAAVGLEQLGEELFGGGGDVWGVCG